MTLVVADPDHPLRGSLEDAIRAVFLAEYGARVPAFPRQLLALLDRESRPLAASGLRFAEDGFFSECYLEEPVEESLGRRAGTAVSRTEVVEFVSLAALRPGAALPLVGGAVRLCLASGCRWGLFTATARLRALLGRAGFVVEDIAAADRERVTRPENWGSYYLHDPRVVAVRAESLPRVLNSAPNRTAAHA
ncbi:MAG TPA: thermostable hemolysin [Candidatus Omnitrophota bacterium]|nr:thermostable hemolysin [Candidatus Omnitrophota bacterium]